MNKKSIIISIIVLVLLILIAIVWGTQDDQIIEQTITEQSSINDVPQAISDDLSGLEITDVNKEFEDIDKQIQGL